MLTIKQITEHTGLKSSTLRGRLRHPETIRLAEANELFRTGMNRSILTKLHVKRDFPSKKT